MVLRVTSFSSRFRPPPDPPPWSLCKPRPLKPWSLIVPPEPPDAPLLLAPPLQTLESSVNPVAFLPRCSSPVPVVAASPLSSFASTSIVTKTVFVSFGVCVSTARCRSQHSSSFQLEPQFIIAETSSRLVKPLKGIVYVFSWNKFYLDECCLVLGVSCLEMSLLPLYEDAALPWNLLLPQIEDVTSDLYLPLHEVATRCYPLLGLLYGVVIGTFVLLALFSMVSGTVAANNGSLRWCIHGMDDARDSQSSSRILYVVPSLAAEALTLQVALPTTSSAGFPKLQVILDFIVLFNALHSGMDLNEMQVVSSQTLPLSSVLYQFDFYHCTALYLVVAIVLCVFFKQCPSITLF